MSDEPTKHRYVSPQALSALPPDPCEQPVSCDCEPCCCCDFVPTSITMQLDKIPVTREGPTA